MAGQRIHSERTMRMLPFAPLVVALAISVGVVLGAPDDAGPQAGGTGESQPLVAQVGKRATSAAHENLASQTRVRNGIREARLRRAYAERAELAESSIANLVVDGKKADQKLVKLLSSRSSDYSEHVEYIDQRPIMPAGCELISLDVALRSMGFDLPLTEIADRYLVSGGGVDEGYQGSPYASGGGYPQSIVNAANKWLAERGEGAARAYNLTKTKYKDLCALVEMGYPVLVWTTEGLASPSVSGNWYWPEHCVVMYGVDGDSVLISDSLAGLVKRDRARFGEIYAQVGSMAAAVFPER